ncbi:hypothetical protein [Halobacteriovorax sp. HLS]|uniref:hypothetical protein n=1 Tax=Halobacteriovorax sp. HLS TaxID=2234000 RepID=UPI000FD9B496|nr:hypothetical protein [Halobacteriovorax sp. HLS]
MPSSKWFPWDFLKSHPHTIDFNKKGFYAIQFCDEFVSHILMERLPSELTDSGNFFKVSAADLTPDWFEEKFQTMSLFAQNESYLVIESQNLPAKTKTWLEENPLSLDDQFLIFSFPGTSKVYDSFAKKINGEFIKIEAPRFWENLLHLEFICAHFNLSLPMNVKNYLIQSLENTSYEFFQAASLLNLYFPGGANIQLEYVQKLIRPNKLDHFSLASSFGSKNKSRFYKVLTASELDFDQLRSLFFFMQNHLFKLMDPSYCDGKSRLSKYDKEILSHSKAWSASELQKEMHIFGELELAAKSKSPLLKNRLRLEYLSSF